MGGAVRPQHPFIDLVFDVIKLSLPIIRGGIAVNTIETLITENELLEGDGEMHAGYKQLRKIFLDPKSSDRDKNNALLNMVGLSVSQISRLGSGYVYCPDEYANVPQAFESQYHLQRQGVFKGKDLDIDFRRPKQRNVFDKEFSNSFNPEMQ